MDGVAVQRGSMRRAAPSTVAVAGGLCVGIAMLGIAVPSVNLAYAQIVPLLLFARAFGLRAALAAALVAAPLLTLLEHRLRHQYGVGATLVDTLVLAAVYTITLYVVDRYESVLLRTYRTEAERQACENEMLVRELTTRLPAEIRLEEAAARERDLSAIAEAIPQLVWRSRGDGRSEYFNSAWTAYTGIVAQNFSKGGFWTAFHEDDRALVRERWEAAISSGKVFDVEFRLRRADGEYRWFLARSTPLRGYSGEIVRWFGTCTDIESQKRLQEQLERQFELAHRVSEAFQHASLPSVMPSVPGVRFSALYRAGKREAAVGGDWYDALRLLDGRLMISIGDVAGSGLGAAITMVAMRQAMRGAAQIHADPVAILEAADRTLREETGDRMVTAFCGVFDPVTRSLAYASAGHPYPLVRRPDGNIVELAAPGLPLGVRRKGDTEARETIIERGAFVVLFTDGLTEATRDFAEGERRLREAIARVALPSRIPAAERLAGIVLAGQATDDVAILTLAFDDLIDDDRYRRFTFDSEDRFAARETRAAFVAALVAAGASEAQLVDAEVVFSELLGNVVRHARGPTDIVIDASGTLPVLSVLDRGRGFSHGAYLPADAFAETGRGLFIVRALTAEFNASRRPDGGSHARAVLFVDRFQSRPARRTPSVNSATAGRSA